MATTMIDITANNASNQHLALLQNTGISTTNHAALQSITTMKTYLLANGYTQGVLDVMCKNDLIFACRMKMGYGL